MSPFDFAPLTLRYAQDERKMHTRNTNEKMQTFVLSVAERQRSEIEGR